MTTPHTPGPWTCYPHYTAGNTYRLYDGDQNFFNDTSAPAMDANARLITAVHGLLAEVEAQYAELADFRNDWPGRDTQQGQGKLCRLRDLISAATGRDAEDVQNDYGTRAAIAKATPHHQFNEAMKLLLTP